jgi:SAM-dependent methyltransferase
MNTKDAYERVVFRVKNQGLLSLFKVIFRKISEFISTPQSKFYDIIFSKIVDSKGLEIGGPSSVFLRNGFIPVYNVVKQIDNLNFSSNTIWEGRIERDNFIVNDRVIGKQFIRDAIDLFGINDSSYDFVLSSEMVQHIANPIKALNEWKRVMKNDGMLILITPNKRNTFDHRRPVTQLSHLIKDYENGITEADLTHLDEALKYHDLTMDRPAGSFEDFKKRSENNFNVRALHHHVFDEKLTIELINYLGLQIVGVERYLSTIVILAHKKDNTSIDNLMYLTSDGDI